MMEHKRAAEAFKKIISNMLITPYKNLFGICYEIHILHENDGITWPEMFELKGILNDHKPNSEQYTQFTESPLWLKDSHYWWFPCEKAPQTISVRIAYLNEVIKTLENESNKKTIK
jgi:hypothetical protein